MSQAAARVEGATKIYGAGDTAVTALDDLTVAFEQGKFTAIMGPSGSGKSTLLHCVAGLDALTEGSAFIGEVNLEDLSEKNITLPVDIAGDDADPNWFDRVVETIGIADRLTHRPAELSGGQQQRVAAARALVSRPEVVFADEPSGNLDSKSSAELLTFMRLAVDEFGQTIVMVTHDPTSAAFADRIVFLEDGRLVGEMQDPTADQVFEHLKSMGD